MKATLPATAVTERTRWASGLVYLWARGVLFAGPQPGHNNRPEGRVRAEPTGGGSLARSGSSGGRKRPRGATSPRARTRGSWGPPPPSAASAGRPVLPGSAGPAPGQPFPSAPPPLLTWRSPWALYLFPFLSPRDFSSSVNSAAAAIFQSELPAGAGQQDRRRRRGGTALHQTLRLLAERRGRKARLRAGGGAKRGGVGVVWDRWSGAESPGPGAPRGEREPAFGCRRRLHLPPSKWQAVGLQS